MFAYICAHTHIYECMYAFTYTNTYVHMYIYICKVDMYIYIHRVPIAVIAMYIVLINVYISINTHAHIQTHEHNYTNHTNACIHFFVYICKVKYPGPYTGASLFWQLHPVPSALCTYIYTKVCV